MTYVTTKEELEAAIERKDPEIIVTGKLAKELKPIAKLTGEMSKIAPWLAAGTGIAALVTGGLSNTVAIPILLAKESTVVKSSSALAILITLCVTFGVVTIVGMLLNYNINMEADFDGRGIIRMSLKKGK